MNPYISIPEAIDILKKGKMLIVVDSPDRENQADLIFAAEHVTAEKINFMLQNCRGMICVPITQAKASKLDLPLMISKSDNTEETGVQFTVTADGLNMQAFGISAVDRARTITTIANDDSIPADLVRPGHIFPLVARPGGVIERAGHTEATIDLLKLAKLTPCGVLSEILSDSGDVATLDETIAFSKKHDIPIVLVDDLVTYVKQNPCITDSTPSVIKVASSKLPTKYGEFIIDVYRSYDDNREHVALHVGGLANDAPIVRIHSQCITGDTFGSLKCDCGEQLARSLEIIAENKQGALIYLNQEGRGVGLTNKIRAYALQDTGLDTVDSQHALGLPVDARDFEVAADICRDMGISKIQLLTNNPSKLKQLEEYGILIAKKLPLEIASNPTNKGYLMTKKKKLGHTLEKI